MYQPPTSFTIQTKAQIYNGKTDKNGDPDVSGDCENNCSKKSGVKWCTSSQDYSWDKSNQSPILWDWKSCNTKGGCSNQPYCSYPTIADCLGLYDPASNSRISAKSANVVNAAKSNPQVEGQQGDRTIACNYISETLYPFKNTSMVQQYRNYLANLNLDIE